MGDILHSNNTQETLKDGYAALEVYGMRDYVRSFLGKTGEEPEV